MEKKTLAIIGGIAAIIIIIVLLLFTGIIHNGSFAMAGTTYGPGTYLIGTDLPEGSYDFESPYSIEGGATFHASSDGFLSISNQDVQLKSGCVVTVEEGGSLTYKW